MAGHGIGIAVKDIYAKAYGDRMFSSPLTELLLKSGRNGMSMLLPLQISHLLIYKNLVLSGKINGRGYYIYEKGSKPKPDSSVLSVVEESRKLTNIMPGGKVRKPCPS